MAYKWQKVGKYEEIQVKQPLKIDINLRAKIDKILDTI